MCVARSAGRYQSVSLRLVEVSCHSWLKSATPHAAEVGDTSRHWSRRHLTPLRSATPHASEVGDTLHHGQPLKANCCEAIFYMFSWFWTEHVLAPRSTNQSFCGRRWSDLFRCFRGSALKLETLFTPSTPRDWTAIKHFASTSYQDHAWLTLCVVHACVTYSGRVLQMNVFLPETDDSWSPSETLPTLNSSTVICIIILYCVCKA